MAKKLPKSEPRRKYFAALVREVMALTACSHADAKTSVSAMLLLLQHRVKNGRHVDLGFMKVLPKTVKPTTILCNLQGKHGSQIHIGETVRWSVRVVKSWQRKNKPAWSRYS